MIIYIKRFIYKNIIKDVFAVTAVAGVVSWFLKGDKPYLTSFQNIVKEYFEKNNISSKYNIYEKSGSIDSYEGRAICIDIYTNDRIITGTFPYYTITRVKEHSDYTDEFMAPNGQGFMAHVIHLLRGTLADKESKTLKSVNDVY